MARLDTSIEGQIRAEPLIKEVLSRLHQLLARATEAYSHRLNCAGEARPIHRHMEHLCEIVRDITHPDKDKVVVAEMHGERLYQQISETARTGDPKARLTEAPATATSFRDKLVKLYDSMVDAQELLDVKAPRNDLANNLAAVARDAEIHAARTEPMPTRRNVTSPRSRRRRQKRSRRSRSSQIRDANRLRRRSHLRARDPARMTRPCRS